MMKRKLWFIKRITKKEILSYLETLKKEKPELIKEIQNKIKAYKRNFNFLEKENIAELKWNTYIKGNTWALLSIIEFSDIECEYCIDFHNSKILEEVINNNPEQINYIFKHFPLPNHQNSKIEAEASMCVQNLSEKDLYLDYLEKLFSNTNWWWEWLDKNKLSSFAWEFWIDSNIFEECLNEWTFSENIENEFNQWRKLGINSVPSTLILNNETWEYVLIKEKTSKEKIEDIVWKLIN